MPGKAEQVEVHLAVHVLQWLGEQDQVHRLSIRRSVSSHTVLLWLGVHVSITIGIQDQLRLAHLHLLM
jgi:hypothetical protein